MKKHLYRKTIQHSIIDKSKRVKKFHIFSIQLSKSQLRGGVVGIVGLLVDKERFSTICVGNYGSCRNTYSNYYLRTYIFGVVLTRFVEMVIMDRRIGPVGIFVILLQRYVRICRWFRFCSDNCFQVVSNHFYILILFI